MTRQLRKLTLAVGLALIFTQNLEAQNNDLLRRVEQFVGENAVKYMQPAVNIFSANLNSGLFHEAEVHEFMTFELGLIGMVATVADDKKTFRAILPDTVYYQNSTYIVGRDYDKIITTPTALGSKNGTKVYQKQAAPGSPSIYEFPGGIELNRVPILTPQLIVGLPVGTELIVRYVPQFKVNEDVGKLDLKGVGLRHSLNQWFPRQPSRGVQEEEQTPVNLAISAMYQKFKLRDREGNDFVDTEVFSAGVQASRRFWLLTFYGGLSYEKATTNISYTYRPTSEYYPSAQYVTFPVRLEDLKGENRYRATAGLALRLLLLDVFADYSFASQPVATLGAVLSLR